MITHSAGPTITFGSGPAPTGQNTAGLNPDAGPNVDYHGNAVLDVRYPYRPGDSSKGAIKAMLNYAYAGLVDAVPSIKSNVIIAAAQTPVVPAGGSVAITLASANVASPASNGSLAVNVPVVPYMGSAGGSLSITAANAQSVLCIDPGHTTGDVAGTTAVSNVADVRMIVPGQYVCIPGANGANKFVARVVAKTQTVSGSGTLTLDTAATSTATGLPIILMEYRQPNDASGGASASAGAKRAGLQRRHPRVA